MEILVSPSDYPINSELRDLNPGASKTIWVRQPWTSKSSDLHSRHIIQNSARVNGMRFDKIGRAHLPRSLTHALCRAPNKLVGDLTCAPRSRATGHFISLWRFGNCRAQSAPAGLGVNLLESLDSSLKT